MRILIDTNILFSTLLFPKSKPANALLYAANNHQIVLTDRNIFELREIIKRKKPNLLPAAETFLAQLSFELIPAVEDTAKTIRDVNIERRNYCGRRYHSYRRQGLFEP